MRLLITGIPGTGKTKFGEYLVSAHGFVHRDLEDSNEFAKFTANPSNYLQELSEGSQKPVISWGFVPTPDQIELVRGIAEHGFDTFWFDGDRPAALRAFQKRGTTSEATFYLQMYRIESSRPFESLGPIPINSFDKRGEFKHPSVIFDEIKKALAQCRAI